MIVDLNNRLIDQFVEWLRQEIQFREALEEWTEITVPFLDSHRDYLHLYSRSTDTGFEFTDDGLALDDLESSGIALTEARLGIIDDVLGRYGVLRSEENALVLRASNESAPAAFAEFIQSMIALDVVRSMARPSAMNLFFELVTGWLDSYDVDYVRRPHLRGRSNFLHEFDVQIPKMGNLPDRLVKTVNRPSRERISSYLFAFHDVQEILPDIKPVVVLNESIQQASEADIAALNQYNVLTIRWDERDSFVRQLGIA